MEIQFDRDDKASGAKVKMTIELTEDITDSEFETLKSSLTESSGFKNSTAKKDGKKIIIEAEADPKDITKSKENTYEAIKESAKSSGFTCKE